MSFHVWAHYFYYFAPKSDCTTHQLQADELLNYFMAKAEMFLSSVRNCEMTKFFHNAKSVRINTLCDEFLVFIS